MGEPTYEWTPVGFGIRRADAVDDGHRMGGMFADELDHPITAPCDERRDPDAAQTELVVEMDVGKRGAWVEEARIDYRAAGGRLHTLVIPWQMIACGTQVSREWCHVEGAAKATGWVDG